MPKTKHRLRTNYTDNTDAPNEKNSGEIVTVQGDALTIPEMIRKYAQGIIPSVGREAYYENPENFGDSITEQLRRPDVDLTDIAEAKKHIKDVQTKHAEAKRRQTSKSARETAKAASAAQQESESSQTAGQDAIASDGTSDKNQKPIPIE